VARLLAIDWDHDELRIVAVNTSRQDVAIEQTFRWPLGEDITSSNGEALGHKLREALRAAGIAPAPVVVCVGRERVVIKELRYPPVPAAEEPALVRFQAAKEMSELPDEVVIDYAPLTSANQGGERHALAVALRKTTAAAWQALCRGLGVKLLALTPRPHALRGAIARARAADQAPAGDTSAILVLGSRWAELSVLHQANVCFARSLAVASGLSNEIKRSLNLYNASNGDADLPSAILLTGKADLDLEQRLRESIDVPVQRLDPFRKSEAVPQAERGLYAAAVGAAYLWARFERLPIHFAAPKQPRVDSDQGKRRLKSYGVTAAALVVLGVIVANVVLADQRSQLRMKAAEKAVLDDQLKLLGQDRLDIKGLQEWEATSVSWLDEIYDLAYHFPHQVGLRVKDFSAGPITKRDPKDQFVAQVTVSVIAKNTQGALVNQFIDALNADRHIRARLENSKDLPGNNQDLNIKIELAKRPLERYTARFTAVPRRTAPIMEATEEPSELPNDDTGEKGGAP
jgi:Tfp pilus assembly PilM family ATPase